MCNTARRGQANPTSDAHDMKPIEIHVLGELTCLQYTRTFQMVYWLRHIMACNSFPERTGRWLWAWQLCGQLHADSTLLVISFSDVVRFPHDLVNLQSIRKTTAGESCKIGPYVCCMTTRKGVWAIFVVGSQLRKLEVPNHGQLNADYTVLYYFCSNTTCFANITIIMENGDMSSCDPEFIDESTVLSWAYIQAMRPIVSWLFIQAKHTPSLWVVDCGGAYDCSVSQPLW